MNYFFTGIYGVSLNGCNIVDLGDGFAIVRINDYIKSAAIVRKMSEDSIEKHLNTDLFLTYTTSNNSVEAKNDFDDFISGIIAIHTIHPIKTQDVIFVDDIFEHHQSSPCSLFSYQWTRPSIPPVTANNFIDHDLLASNFHRHYSTVCNIYKSDNAEFQNALTCLNLGLEHNHEYIRLLLWTIGIEAIIESSSGKLTTFQHNLGTLLGPSICPPSDWCDFSQSDFLTKTISFELYKIRSKIAHGADLRQLLTAGQDHIDFGKAINTPNAYHINEVSELACLLLIMCIQKKFNL